MLQAIHHFNEEINRFYPEYLKAHSDGTNRLLHFVGATSFFTLVILAFVNGSWLLIPLAIFIGYLLPGIGHHHFQHNKSFRDSKPVLCVICAFRLYIDMLCFRIGKRIKELS